MPEIQVPEIARQLARKFAITGGHIAPSLAPEIVPVALVSDLTAAIEQDVIAFRPAIVRMTTGAGGAGNYTSNQLWNPANSGVVVELQLALVDASQASGIRINIHDTKLTTDASGSFRDRRIGGSSAAHGAYATPAAIPGTFVGFVKIPANETVAIPLDFVIGEGSGVVLVNQAANEDLDTTYFWVERPILEGE